jgi:hypothetical protein
MNSNILLVEIVNDDSERAIPRSTCDVPLSTYIFNLSSPLIVDKEDIYILQAEHISRTRAPARPVPEQILITADGEVLARYFMTRDEDPEAAIRIAFGKLHINADSW